MIGFISRFILVIAGFLTSFFVSKDALHFPVFQIVVAVSLTTIIVTLITFWPEIKQWFRSERIKK